MSIMLNSHHLSDKRPMKLLMISWSLRLRTADAAASGSANSRNPKPFGLPVSLSCTRRKLFTCPTLPNVSMICSSLTPASWLALVAAHRIYALRTIWDVADENDSSILFGCHVGVDGRVNGCVRRVAERRSGIEDARSHLNRVTREAPESLAGM